MGPFAGCVSRFSCNSFQPQFVSQLCFMAPVMVSAWVVKKGKTDDKNEIAKQKL